MTNESAILGLLAKQEQQIAALAAENAQLRQALAKATSAANEEAERAPASDAVD